MTYIRSKSPKRVPEYARPIASSTIFVAAPTVRNTELIVTYETYVIREKMKIAPASLFRFVMKYKTIFRTTKLRNLIGYSAVILANDSRPGWYIAYVFCLS